MPQDIDLPIRIIRYGVDEPLPERRQVHAGPVTATLEGGFLRYVTLDGQEIVRGIYAAVRDRNWGTIEPRFTAYDFRQDDDSFLVRFTAEHRHAEIDFVWQGMIAGAADGTITYTLDGTARTTFLRNRIGFCVLHPMDLAGTPVEVETPDGVVSGTFPKDISPYQPFFDIAAIRQPRATGGGVEVRFHGDLFEMEDQRNWTDASYKTYCTPLRLPFPVEVKAGARIEQSVTVRVARDLPPSRGPAPCAARKRAPGIPPPSPQGKGERTPPAVPQRSPFPHREGGQGVRSLAVTSTPIGVLPPLGLGMASHGHPLTTTEIQHLRHLHAAHLRAILDLSTPDWEATLRRGAAEAVALGTALELEVITADDDGAGLDALAAALAQQEQPPPRLARLLVFPRSGVVTTEPVVSRARRAIEAAGVRAHIGGGTRADFVMLNRATLPLDLMDVVGYAINPQVHAFDNASLVETLAAQAITVQNARRIAGARAVAVGPVTLKQRVNPAATAPDRPPAPDELPPLVDPRQLSLFAAGWTVGSLRHLAGAGAASLTYFETTGRLGVMEATAGWAHHQRFPSRPSMNFPVYHVLAAVGELAGADLLPVHVAAPLQTEALALRSGQRLRLLIANLTDDRQRVLVDMPRIGEAQLRLLDETTASQAASDPTALRQHTGQRLSPSTRRLELDLLPFAMAMVDGQFE